MATPKKPSKKTPKTPKTLVPATDTALLADVRQLIADAREVTTTAVNSAVVLLYWQVGHLIRTEVFGRKRADYGEQIVPNCRHNWRGSSETGSGGGTCSA